MNDPLKFFAALCVCALCGLSVAQEANVLGLPAVPQPKPGSVPPSAAGTPGASGSKAPAPQVTRDAISGELGLQHSAREGVGRLIVTTRTVFATAGTRGAALDTARLVQKELALSCGKQCKPIKMSEPKLLTSGQLEFELAFSPLHQHLSQAQFIAALQGKPLNLTPAQLQPPPAPSVSVNVGTVSAAPSQPPQSSPSK
ncbi:MAG: hypothetical protein ACKO1L_01740 [Brachymonas sp.]